MRYCFFGKGFSWVRFVLVYLSCLLSSSVLATEISRVDLFGKPLSVNVVGADTAQQKNIDQQLLIEIGLFKRLGDELNQLNSTGAVQSPSAYLLELLQLCDQWEKNTEQAFSCRLGGLQKEWDGAVAKKELPDRSELRKKSRSALQQGWVVNAGAVALTDAAKKSGFTISAEGMLHAFVLDKLVKNVTSLAVKQSIKLQSLQLNFAGQQRCWSKADSGSQCVVNRAGSFVDSPLARIAPATNAVVMIDPHQELQKVGSYTLSKILIPKEGWPVEFAPSVMVVAADAVTAAVIARSLVVKPIAAGVRWVDSQPGIEALIMTDTGTIFPTRGWYSLLIPDAEHQPLWSGDKQFLIEYQTLEHHVAEYRRPCVALWITNSEQQLVRQLVVQGDNLRWLKEIPLWWRKYGRNNEQSVDGLARATTAPGSHMVVWDGRDDKGHKVPKGNYTLHIEAAREHGEHEVVILGFALSGQSFTALAAGEKELGVIKVSFEKESF